MFYKYKPKEDDKVSEMMDRITSLGQKPAADIQEAGRAREAEKAKEESRTDKVETEEKNSLSKPRYDEYIPEKKPEDSKKAPDEKKSGERCRASTDKVDREIEKLKKEKEKLEGELRGEKDESKSAELERQLAQVERELREKDNDAYRRQHMEVTKL